MKKIFSILSLGILLFGNLTQCFANNNYTEEELGNIMLNFFNAEVEKSNTTTDIQESNTYKPSEIKEEREDEIEYVGGDEHIVWNKTKGIITVYTGDLRFGITLEEKNLGAENIGNTGNYYKWGNNSSINTENYKNIQSIKEDNAWGGGDDLDTSNSSIFRGYDLENHKATNSISRQGPCNEGFHVPSAGEISELVKLYYNLKGMSNSINDRQGGSQIYDSNLNFINDLKIPRAGVIGNGMYFDKGDSFFQSSTKKGEYYGYHFYQTSTNIMSNGSSKDIDYGIPVRCFKNEYEPYSKTVTFNPNGGAFSGMEVNQTKKYTYTVDENGIVPIYNIQIPNRISKDISQQSGWMFAGWYTKDGKNNDWGEEFDISNPQSTTAYAKWLPFNDLKVKLGDLTFTIMDRNLGALTDDISNTNSYGYYYQWGNNYGFSGNITNISNNGQIKQTEYGPSNYYYSNIFRKNENWNSTNYNTINMWGGNNALNPYSDRKGPCPDGYHIPNGAEWKMITNYYKNWYSTNSNNEICEGLNEGKCFSKIFKVPLAGLIRYGDLTKGNENVRASLWSSEKSWQSNNNRIISINENISDVADYISYGSMSNFGQSVRCTKDIKYSLNFEDSPIIKYFNYYIPISEEHKPINPDKKGSSFLGRYNNGNKFIFGTNNYLNGDTNLEAKREKKPKYILNSNGGTFEGGNEKKEIEYELLDINISHTENINDNGEQIGPYNENQSITSVYTITGAEEVVVFIKVLTKMIDYNNGIADYAVVRSGNKENFSPEINHEKSVSGKLGGFINENKFREYNIKGDAATIGFKSYEGGMGGPNYGYYSIIKGFGYPISELYSIPRYPGYELLGWYEEDSETPFDIENTPITEDKTLYAHWKSLKEKAQEATTENIVYTNTTSVTVGDDPVEEVLSGSSTLTLVSKEVEDTEVKKEEDTTKVQGSEIRVTSDKTVEYEGGLEVYLEKTESIGTQITTGKVEGTIKFSAPVAVKIPISSDVEYVKVQVKHGDEDFGFKGLTLNPINECNSGEAVNDKYNGEDLGVTGNTNKYATIYTCSASTFVAYTENLKPVIPQPSAGGGRTINSTNQETKITEQEHNSADTVKETETTTQENTPNETTNKSVEEKIQTISPKSLTRGELAVFSDILLDIFPKLTEGKKNVNEVCTEYTDYQEFSSKEQKAVSKLCRLAIMGIHEDDKTPLETFGVHNLSTNEEFIKVVNRMTDKYSEEELKDLKSALSSLEENKEENLSFGTVVNIFKKVKNLFE